MDAIDRHLTRGSSSSTPPTITELAETPHISLSLLPDDQLHSAIKMALLLAKRKMNQYYGNTDESNAYRIVMGTPDISWFFWHLFVHTVLHPGLKLAYFKKQKWPEDWIATAKQITRDEYETYVQLRAATGVVSDPVVQVRPFHFDLNCWMLMLPTPGSSRRE
jgi:hypothetical protein